MKTLIIIPTYNERQNIEPLFEAIFTVNNDVNILVVDDNSPDKTYELVDELQQGRYKDKVFLLRREGKLGLGTAYVAGFKWALANRYDYIMEMDADFSHNPIYINDFLREIKNADLVIGSRYVPGGGVVNWGIGRKFISRGGSLYSRTILGLPLNDITGGYKCFRREVLESINLDSIKSNGYSFQVEMNYRTFLKGFRIKEIPIIFEDRRVGQSKMSRKIFIEAIMMVWRLRLSKSELRQS
ncbi:dolichyl-phosphate beta-D-mannosyltransferase [Anaerosporomusa subterranea]|uniref:Dolichyl-phosphate beta-D-mannosyltransferase n=1 Tax=Anaerosporomusa subterranea TaxID=1794912 RepID=A0A154BR43_ANASB|nr:polyprenol monophosphomannose synthase [Anaerosporomusa subterranea]KYZ76412.1 dolichyl-phosphate beta-D-mannosyltransferase [Anaerosporomusa subterranea]